MTKVFTSRTNGLELHIPADMGAAVRFFSVGEDARKVIDDGSTSTRTDDPDQLKSELARARAKIEALEAKEAENARREAAESEEAEEKERERKVQAAMIEEAAKPAKVSKRQALVAEPALD